MSNHNIAGINTQLLDFYFTTSDTALESAEIAAINVRSDLKKIQESSLNFNQKIAASEKLFPTIKDCITTLRNAQHNQKWRNNDEFKAEFLKTLATETNITIFQSDCAKEILLRVWTLVVPPLEKINSIHSNGAGDSKINDANKMLKILLQKIEKEYSSAMQIFRFQHKTLSKQLDQHKTILESDNEKYKTTTENLYASRSNILYYSSNNSENKATVFITLLKHLKFRHSAFDH